MVINTETLLLAGLAANLVTEIAKILVKQPAQDAKIDELHKALDDTLAQLRQLVK